MWGPYPNNAWGFGKVNAFESLTTCSLINNMKSINNNINSFNIYPNPAISTLNVEITGSLKNRITIYDINGRKISNFVFNHGNFSLPLTSLLNGVYILELQPESGNRIIKRFVVSK